MLIADLAFLLDRGPEVLLQVVAAMIAGGLLGFERQRMSKPVGMLTSVLVATGATIIVLAGPLLIGDGGGGEPTRMASMIVNGIGFIGAGAIIRSRFKVSGLASAATIWTVGALGIVIGSGHALLGLGLALIVFFLLRGVPKLEHLVFARRSCVHVQVTVEPSRTNELLEFLVENHASVTRTRMRSHGDRVVVSLDECGVEHRRELMQELRRAEGVLEVADARAS